MHYDRKDSYLFVNETEVYKFKEKDSEIAGNALCLGNISKDWSTDNLKKKTELNSYVYGFGVDYVAITVNDIINIQKYLMKKII